MRVACAWGSRARDALYYYPYLTLGTGHPVLTLPVEARCRQGRPFRFNIGLGMVIKGWDEGVMQMSLGEKAVLTITSDYGYGPAGAGGVIPPNDSTMTGITRLLLRRMASRPY